MDVEPPRSYATEMKEETEGDETSDVVAWSSSHLSEDDSDDDEGSSLSRSPSRSTGSDEHAEHSEPLEQSTDVDAVSVEDFADDWMHEMDVDLPDGTSPLRPTTTSSVSLVATIKEPVATTSGGLQTANTMSRLDEDPTVSVPEPVAASAPVIASPTAPDRIEPLEETKPKPVSQIPRLVPPLARKFSLNAASPPTSPPSSPPRLQRSPSKTQSLGAVVVEPQVSPTSLLRRGQSVYVPASQSTTPTHKSTSQRGIVSTSSQFWASEQNRRSSRLLDEWKRKEIWHDFKRAEENVLTNPSTTTTTTDAALDSKFGSASSLDDALQGIRSDILTKQSELRPPLRRATSFATKMGSASPERAIDGSGDEPAGFGGSHETWHVRSAMVTPLTKTSQLLDTVSKAEYDRLVDDRRRLAEDAESRHRALLAEQELSRSLQERLLNLENSDRENRFLKEEIQKHLMHELSSKELVRTLEDQLALTARSEDQLKMQTRQLMQQNQTLQTDLLEKMAGETAKIQKMAHLSAEKQKLQADLQRHETQGAQQVAQQRTHVHATMLRHVLSATRRRELQSAFGVWHASSRARTDARRTAALAVASLAARLDVKALARSFHSWHAHARAGSHADQLCHAEQVLATAHECQRDACRRAGASVVQAFLRRRARTEIQSAWSRWHHATVQRASLEQRLAMASAKLKAVLRSRRRASKQRAFSTWMLQVSFEGERIDGVRAKQTEAELVEAKDCVFSLSRAKTRLEEKLQSARQDGQRTNDQLREHRAELQLVKHGFVATVVRATERQCVRSIFDAWRVHTRVEACAKEFRLQLEMAELQVEEREKYARSLDDYNKVLRNDLERFQFFSQDKRVAVDVLTKKLLREEDTRKHMEEQHVVLEEKMLAYKGQLASLLEWGTGATMPLALVHLCRDATIGNLRELFARLATASRTDNKGVAPRSPETSPGDSDDVHAASSVRVATSDVAHFLRDTNALSESAVAQSDVGALVRRHTPEYAETQGLSFTDFVSCLNAVAKDAFEASSAPKERAKVFWSSLLGHGLGGQRSAGVSQAHRDGGETTLHATRSPWAGQLSEDILQNQEKLLAVLEHETAVVERAVMEKSSLKHTYAASEHSVGSTVKEFHEYQCEPVVPLESQPGKGTTTGTTAMGGSDAGVFPSADCQFQENGLSQFANWSQSGQVQDLFLAFRVPLVRVVTKYSNEQRVAAHGNQVCLLLSGVARMLEDMRLYPTYISRDLVHHHFGRLCDRDGLLTPQALAVFLGCCALELFAKSLPAANNSFRLSAREIVLSFFCDLGLLPESEIPAPPRICLVGADVETVLWPLYEYYSLSEEGAASLSAGEPRVGMTQQKFVRFATDIVNTAAAAAERLFQRVLSETRRPGASTPRMVLHLDEFYVALAYLQAERCPSVQYANLGEAVRHWMQQTQ